MQENAVECGCVKGHHRGNQSEEKNKGETGKKGHNQMAKGQKTGKLVMKSQQKVFSSGKGEGGATMLSKIRK